MKLERLQGSPTRAQDLGRQPGSLCFHDLTGVVLDQCLTPFVAVTAVGINSAAPPLADDIYVFVCHDSGSARERFIVRMGKTLNQAVFDENNGREGYTEQLGYAMLSLPAGTCSTTSKPLIIMPCCRSSTNSGTRVRNKWRIF